MTNTDVLLAKWNDLMDAEADKMFHDVPLPEGHTAAKQEVSDALLALGWDIDPGCSGFPVWKFYGVTALDNTTEVC